MGDPAGIGAEIVLKALPFICNKSIPVIVGDIESIVTLQRKIGTLWQGEFKKTGKGKLGEAEFVDMHLLNTVCLGIPDSSYGYASYMYILEALKLVFLGHADAIVTCPINKASFHSAGVPFTGHTELLAHFGGVTDYVMMMANPHMKVSLVTIHIPLIEVPKSISQSNVLKCILMTARFLKEHFKIEKPLIKVCGLNPHAGEEGILGNEEDCIKGAIKDATDTGENVLGPYPADTVFHKADCDAFVAMYHDQGLIPVKTLDFDRTVNITLGLPFIRTSPGHGTGYDIAGKGVANPLSFIEAYKLAERIAPYPDSF